MKIAFLAVNAVWAVNGRENIRETKCVAFAYLMHISREWRKCCCKKLAPLKHIHNARKWTTERGDWTNERTNENVKCRTRNLFTSYALSIRQTSLNGSGRALPFSIDGSPFLRLQFCTYIWKSYILRFFPQPKCIFHTISSTSLIFYYISHYRCISEHVLSRQTRKSKMYLA